MSLTDTKVKNARPSEKAVKLTDGFGLYLLVHPNGSKYWQLGYRFDGKQKVFSIGVYPAVSLADARQRRDEAKRLLAQGIDPNAKKQADEKVLQEKRDKTRSFRVVAKSWFATKTKWSEDYADTVVSVVSVPSGHNLMYSTKWCTPNSGGNQSVRYAEKCDFRQA